MSDKIDRAGFVELMAPTVAVLHALCTAIADASARNGHIAHEPSVGMDDLAAEARYQRSCGPDWDQPVRDTHSFGGITMLAATDYGHCYASLFEADRLPVYGFLALARAGLEACVISCWLNDPRIDTEERVKRGLCEQLYSANEVLGLGLEGQGKAADVKDALLRCGKALGWTVEWDRTRKPIVGGARRPDIRKRIAELVVGREDRPVGPALWSYLSAVIHVTWYGLRPGVVEPPTSDLGLGPSLATFGTDTKTVNAQSYGLLRALRQAGEARQTLMGWDDEVWLDAAAQSEAHEAGLLQAIIQSAQ